MPRTIIAAHNLPFQCRHETSAVATCNGTDGGDVRKDYHDLHHPIHNHPALFAAAAAASSDNSTFVGIPSVPHCSHCTPDIHSLNLNPQLIADFYDGFCKERLWPILHYHLWEHPLVDAQRERALWSAYSQVNRAFAETIAKCYRPGDRIVVLDYHLMLVPAMLRELLGREATIAFSLVCVFPSSEYFRCLPRAKALLRGILGASMVIMQTGTFARHFGSTLVRVLGLGLRPSPDPDTVIVVDDGEREIAVLAIPFGVAVEQCEEEATGYAAMQKLVELRSMVNNPVMNAGAAEGLTVILGIDRADQMRGIRHKLVAIDYFFEHYPELIGKICVPERVEDKEAEIHVNDLVNTINSKYGCLSYCPVHYHHRDIAKDEYYALLAMASIFVNTVERDAISATPLEFVVTQPNGAVVMSEFTGLADGFSESIQFVNPWHTKVFQWCS